MEDMMEIRKKDKDIEDEYDMMPISPQCVSMGMMQPMQQSMMPMQQIQSMMQMMPMQPMMGMMPMMPMEGMMMSPSMDDMKCYPLMQTGMMREVEEDDDDEFEDDEFEDDESRYDGCNPRYVLMKIERYNPEIFRTMRMYGIPYPVAQKLTRKIIRLTLRYCDRDKYDYDK